MGLPLTEPPSFCPQFLMVTMLNPPVGTLGAVNSAFKPLSLVPTLQATVICLCEITCELKDGQTVFEFLVIYPDLP